MAAHIVLGILIGLLAYAVQSLGLTFQRKSHVLNNALSPDQRLSEYRRPLWLLGVAIFISSNLIGSVVQIASLPVVILAPLGAVSLLWNAFFAWFILADVFSPWMVLGTLLIAAGAVLIALFGIVPEETRSLDDLLELLRRPTFIAYFSVLSAVVILCLSLTHIVEFSLASPSTELVSSPSTISLDIDPEPTRASATERTPLLDSKPTPSPHVSLDFKPADVALETLSRTRLLVAISYASFSGILSGMCLLFAKSGIELLLLTINGDNQFWRWQAWLLILGLIVFALLQLWYLHKALILADPTIVCPSAFCFYNLSSIVNGLVYFNQFSLIPPIHLLLVAIGIIVLLAGVWVVTIHTESPADTSDEEDTETESQIESLPPEREPSSVFSVPEAGSSAAAALQVGRERRATSYTYSRYSTTSNVQLTTDNGTLGGFQIGLSPMSPGFEIVPRRRRVSGMLGDEGSEVRGRRRAVSESGNVPAERPEPGRWRGWWRRRRR